MIVGTSCHSMKQSLFLTEAILAVRRTTILQIIPELETGGAELSTIEIAGAIAQAGGRALVLSEGGRLAPKISAAGGEFVPFPAATKNPARILWNAGEIARLIERENVDLVHARSRAPAWSTLIAARRKKIPLVTTYHGAYGEKNRIKSAYNSVMARGDLVIANSNYTAALIQSRYGTPDERLRVIYRGVDGGYYDPARIADSQTEALRTSWNVGAHQKIMLQAARLTAWKGHHTVIAAAEILKNKGLLGDAVFVLAGDAQGRDSYCRQLEAGIEVAGLKDHFRLPGHVEHMPVAFRAAHVAIIASVEPEAFGRTAAEAQAMGCPVIATNIGAPPETVRAAPFVDESARTGWLVPPSDAAALASALAEALSLEPDARARIGRTARNHVLQAFTLEAMRRQTLAVYDNLLNSGLEQHYNRGKRETSP